MGLRGPVSVFNERRGAPARLRLAQPGSHGLPVALPARRPAALGDGLLTVDALAGGARTRVYHARFERVAAGATRPRGHALGSIARRAYVAKHARERAPGRDGAKRRKGRKAHLAVDTLGQLLGVVITPAKEQERAQVGELCRQVQEVTGQRVRW